MRLVKVDSVRNKIYAEDCFKTMQRLKDKEVSLILTSPPYNTSKHTTPRNRDITMKAGMTYT